MTQPTQLDLTLPNYPWREVPMPGANEGLKMVRLDASDDTFAILGRFPVGFEREEVGGYCSPEEFLVLDGHLELEGSRYERGDLTFIPSRYLRTSMRASDGCTVLAWFRGPAVFHSADALKDPVTSGIVTVSITASPPGELLRTPGVDWTKHDSADHPQIAEGHAVSVALTQWQHLRDGMKPDFRGPYITRVPG